MCGMRDGPGQGQGLVQGTFDVELRRGGVRADDIDGACIAEALHAGRRERRGGGSEYAREGVNEGAR